VYVQAPAQVVPLIPREILFGDPERAAPQISPDGTRIAYLAPKDNVLNIWLRTLGKEDDRPITREGKRGIQRYFWAEDNRHVIYLQDSDGDENWHVYSVDLTTDTVRDMTPFPGVRAQLLRIDPSFPDQILLCMNLRDRRCFDVYRFNLDTGALVLDTENPGDVAEWLTDHDFRVRAARAMIADGGAELRVRDNNESPWRQLVVWEPEDNLCSAIAFTPDGTGIYLRDSRNADTMQLVEINIDTGAQTILVSDPEYDIGAVIIHPRTHRIQTVSIVKERGHVQVLDRSIEKDIAAIRTTDDGDFFLLNRDGSDRNWVIGFITDDGPTPFYVFDRQTHNATLLFADRPRLAQYTLAPMAPIVLRARDGLALHGYLTLPIGVQARNLPMVLKVHGGPWDRDRWGFDPDAQWLANRGYACLQVNFRGSIGYGKQLLNAGSREWGAKMHDDLIDAVHWAVMKRIADPERVAIYGWSYGGYAALVAAALAPDVFACAIDRCGPSNIMTLIDSAPPYWKPMRTLFQERVGDADTEEEFLKTRSPLFKADQISIPILIAQGANDPRVKQFETEQIVHALRSKGKVVEYIVFPDEGHGLVRPENRLRFYTAAESFLARYLGGRVEE
jgi:dipeptidyl aminopeptidase/acylaminoacyl peptidase